jgi:hypothetical protein
MHIKEFLGTVAPLGMIARRRVLMENTDLRLGWAGNGKRYAYWMENMGWIWHFAKIVTLHM